MGSFAGDFQFGDHTVTVPDGFVVELAAAPPLTDRPITADFDEQGRLYVAESSGSNDTVEQQLKDRPHSILRLADTDNDGVFDQRTVFADKMMFPAGTLWHDGSLYVTAPPEIWKLTDTDDDGVADERELWFNPGTLTGCANDLHGPYLGPDGWIYWCKGAFAEQNLTLTTGQPFRTRAAHIFRRHPDGGGVEPVMTGGMDNPVEVAFTPGGERFFSSTFIQHPEGGKRDGIIHAIYGGTYGKIHNVIDDHPRTGEILPTLVHLGPAAACALMHYESDAFGPDYQNNLFSSSFNLQKITRHKLIKEGSTFRTVDEDFFVSNNSDFHPTHIREDADGSLLIVDTGGWYKLCCPTSQLHKPDILGTIYRVRRANHEPPSNPRGSNLNWKDPVPNELAARLGDPRPAVRKRAINSLAKRDASGVTAARDVLENNPALDAQIAAIWALTRIDNTAAREAILKAVKMPNDSVRQAALHSIALWRDQDAVEPLMEIVRSGTPHNRRVAAEALGRIQDSAAVEALVEAAASPVDRILEHSITYALIEIGDTKAIQQGLNAASPHSRRVALIALDQLNELKAETVIPLLSSSESLLQETANWVVNRHNDWGTELSGYFEQQISDPSTTPSDRKQLAQQIARFGNDRAIKRMISDGLRSNDPIVRENSLRAVAQTKLNGVPQDWSEPLSELVAAADAKLEIELIFSALKALPLDKTSDEAISRALINTADRTNFSVALRIKALGLVPQKQLTLNRAQFDLLIRALDQNSSVTTRSIAARTLARARLSDDQVFAIADIISNVGSIELRDLLQVFANRSDEAVGLALLEGLSKRETTDGLRKELIAVAIEEHPNSVQVKAQELYAKLNQDTKQQRERLDELLASLSDGDIRRGQTIFNSEQAACSACHSIGYLGGTLGPDLTRIGTARTERDLLEAILFPSASFVRSYEPVNVTIDDDLSYSGILKEEGESDMVLMTGLGTETRITRSDVKEITPGNVSLMPDGLMEALSKQEMADLLAFLKSTKWK